MANKPQYNKELQNIVAIALLNADGYIYEGCDLHQSESPRSKDYLRKAKAVIERMSKAGYKIREPDR
ncbi:MULTISPECIES: hypothetical protein [Leptolyngbya]|nr:MULTISPECIES: hypothetical protein [Leptolyngbya]MBD2401670.1 hypothetical protein [Leptolyngbya sp. FACHB-239]MBD2406591.1 hypothetical protein [Leptolyngbya sp. FACHB-402]ULP32158.1 hypothetical protein MCP04_10415 [Leptolyngbya boryana IU 594]